MRLSEWVEVIALLLAASCGWECLVASLRRNGK